jgi:sensor c-di-GMP phosphodiesterase-like protein
MRKQRPVNQLVYVVAAVVAGLVPTVAFVTVSYFQEIRETQVTLRKLVALAVQRAERLLTDAEVKLTRFVTVTEGRVTPESVKLLGQLVYNDPRFREAGIIDERGYLVHTTVSPIEYPIEVAPDQRSKPEAQSLQVIGPLKTKVMGEQSIVLALPTRDYGEVNLLVDPTILKHFLDGIELGPSGHVRFVSAAGQLLASIGIAPLKTVDRMTSTDPEEVRIEGATHGGRIRVIADVPKDWVLRGWYHNLKLAIPVTAACTALLMFFLLRIILRPSGLLDHDLRLGLKKNQLQVQYQPIVDLKTGRCIGVEALTRWQHPEYGDVRPTAYVPLAEQTGLISELTEWMLRRVVAEQEVLLQQPQGMYVAVNCAASLLSSADVERIVQRVLRPSAIPPSSVVLEITEGVFPGG